MRWLRIIDSGLGRVAYFCGWIASVAFILLTLNVFYDVVARYAFNSVSIGMQEMEWHLYSVVFLMGIPYALRTDGHVRVDVFYTRWSETFKAWVNLIGALLLVIPLAGFIAWLGIDFAYESYKLGEGSGDPGGLPHRWIIKSLISFSSFFTAVAGIGMVTYAIRVLKRDAHYEDSSHSGGGLA
ncbi:TRAP-type mannitol/chloroaromatic compound transport system, small permease component [Marinobacter daqiaonensis]|uniref:TRAP transporter small permease protein n=1 Tax=Marinobacter daqiaonensis TaxID=650891 RepID=A0A1I6I602_9GAMM|nr:TRAP transporter small permease subunit [Marinobacter daqiaonensis]SFR62165.1 TRAP-type mannitol/chloroaromatic compound transport system, small permease component [Marinobacter daqiaonensis]